MEILAIILAAALPLRGYHKGRTNLLLVCRTWGNVINTNPSIFWTTLSTEDPPSQHDRLLNKSRQMPLTVYLDDNSADDDSANYPPSRKLLEDVGSQRLALREVVYIGFDSPLVVNMFEALLFAPAPRLRSLDFLVYGGCTIRAGDSKSQDAQINSVATPNLTSLSLSGVSIPWSAAVLRGLRSLTLESLGGSRSKSPTLRELSVILQGCPDLQYLTLRLVDFCQDDRQEVPITTPLNGLMKINLWGRSVRPTCDILQHIQYPRTATLSIMIERLVSEDSWQVDLGVVLSRVTQIWIAAPIHVEVDRPRLKLSATNFRFNISSPNEERENTAPRITYRKIFSTFGAPTLAAVTSLSIDSIAGANSTAILTAANEFFPNLTELSVSPYQRLKSKKPWHKVLEKVVQSTEEPNRPVWLCPKLTSFKITTANRDCPDLLSILQLVRIRNSDRKSKGKQVAKSPITSISMNLDSGRLSPEQLGLLNELKGEIADVRCTVSL
ncbi:hypothetical protein FRC01_005462 [Tulasnella sp. 417]|nr:hypothetical protein FRC01_005462 [Tulasnella sp. 417]